MERTLGYPCDMDTRPGVEGAAVGNWDLDSGDVARFQAGDQEAFESLVSRREREVYLVAYRLLGNRDDALDAAQETFLRAFRGLPRFRGEATFRTWITGIALNVCRNKLASAQARAADRLVPLHTEDRSEGDALEVPLTSADPGPEESAYGGELRRALEAGLRAISGEHREILVMREIQGLDYDELASVLSCPVGTVKSRLARARRALREALKGIWP